MHECKRYQTGPGHARKCQTVWILLKQHNFTPRKIAKLISRFRFQRVVLWFRQCEQYFILFFPHWNQASQNVANIAVSSLNEAKKKVKTAKFVINIILLLCYYI